MKKIGLSLIFVLLIVFQMSAQSLLKNGKIPKDLTITLISGGTIKFATYYTYKINFDGKVFYQERSNLPPLKRNANDFLLIGQKPPKPPKLKEKFSKNQLKRFIFEFEKSGFVEINEEDYCQPTLNHYTTKGLSITANGKTKKVEFYDNCNYEENPLLKSFFSLYDKISEELKTVKKQKVKNQ